MRWLPVYLTLRFLGWSADGSFYARTDDTPGGERTVLCLTDPLVPSPTWPAGIQAAAGGCATVAGPDAVALVQPPVAARTGPRGETLAVGGPNREVQVVGAGKIETRGIFAVPPGGAVEASYWRPGGYGVAYVTGGRRELRVMHWRSPAEAAEANRKGVQTLRRKDLAGAVAQFDRALAADPFHVLAHYNRACARALGGDAAGAVADLRWLEDSADPAARLALAKGGADPDLAALRRDPDVKAMLDAAGGATCADRCELEHARCEEACPEGNVRACSRMCGTSADECAAKCD
jgi:hypothetical protein